MTEYKKDIHIVEDMILPCIIEMGMGNIIAWDLVEYGHDVTPGFKFSCDTIVAGLEKAIEKEPGERWSEYLRLYKDVVNSIDKQQIGMDDKRRAALSRRIKRALDVVDDHFKRNKFGTRKIIMVAVEWGIMLILGGAICLGEGMVETFQKIHDICRDELPDEIENFDALSASVLKQTEKLHNAMVNHGLFKEKTWTTLQSQCQDSL